MATERLLLRDVIGGFAPGQDLRAVLLLTYSFDGKWLEEGFVPDLFDRRVTTALVLRDRNVVVAEAPSVRYYQANASFSRRVFHPKLGLFVAEDRALAVIGSANLTRGGLERNLELASTYEVTARGGPRSLFQSLFNYVGGPLAQEVTGAPASAVRDTEVALGEVLKRVPKNDDSPHLFLHNYERTLWEQILEALPHRHVARVTVVSPFFEPNITEREDPRPDADDGGPFARLFSDLVFDPPKGERPVVVFFQQSEGRTLLPVDKLKARMSDIELYQRLSTSDDPRPLHGKMLVIEGARGKGREPFVVAVHGSPNFTSAALLSRPPEGNAEIAVLTKMPARRSGSTKTWSVLGLERLFGKVNDWGTLTYVSPEREPLPSFDAFRLNDAFLRVGDRKLELTWEGNALGAVSLRLLVELNGVWTSLGSVPVTVGKKITIDVPDLTLIDESGLLSLRASWIRVEMVNVAGVVVATSVSPINVDCPQQFCGLAMVGKLMATLDQRIAFAGCGVPQTYREQQKFLEQHRAKDHRAGKDPTFLTHQADLDLFFRNLHAGFRGMRARADAMPNSEFTLRRSVRDLGRWYEEVLLPDGQIPTNECRLFLIDRLGRALQHTLDLGQNSKVLAPRLGAVVREFEVATALKAASEWVESIHDTRLDDYIEETARRLRAVAVALNKLGGE
jgi:hypothetical protein